MCYSLKYRKIKESVVCLTNLTNETRLVDLKNENHTSLLFGAQDKHLALLEDAMDVVINSRGSHLEIIGTEENTATVEEIFNHLEELIKRSIQVGPSDVVTAIKMAKTIARLPPIALEQIKEVALMSEDVPLNAGLSLERKSFQLLFDTQDQKEGMQAFIEKRHPHYQGK